MHHRRDLMPDIKFYPDNLTITVADGTLLIEAIRQAGLYIDAPCGGQGKCRKCQVTLLNRESPVTVLACHFIVTEDLTVALSPRTEAQILTDSSVPIAHLKEAQIKLLSAVIPCPAIGDCDSLCGRVSSVLEQLTGEPVRIPLTTATTLYQQLEKLPRLPVSDEYPSGAWKGFFVLQADTLLAIREQPGNAYVLAYDLGTTTIVSYLLDAVSGKTVHISSTLNPQTVYGADVISRCEYAVSDPESRLTSSIQSAIAALAEEHIRALGIDSSDIFFAVLAGNTCMEHLLLGVSPDSLLHAPYLATIDQLICVPAASLTLPCQIGAQAAVLPCIAGFVGGDTIAVLLSLPQQTFDSLTLVLDIGTNGELILGKGDQLYTCSTAAGPAFEGARISCGMRGAPGAIDHVSVEDGKLKLHVIGDGIPTGICGSGLLDLVACLLDLGIISKRGRLEKPAKWPDELKETYGVRFVTRNNVSALLLTDDENGIYLSQKDIREVQLAKAAIASGIELLCQEMKVSDTDISQVLLAGAFGTYLSPKSACRIGLIPEPLLERIRAIGNAAGEGAKLAACSRTVLEQSQHLAKQTHFVELATSRQFQETYLKKLNF